MGRGLIRELYCIKLIFSQKNKVTEHVSLILLKPQNSTWLVPSNYISQKDIKHGEEVTLKDNSLLEK